MYALADGHQLYPTTDGVWHYLTPDENAVTIGAPAEDLAELDNFLRRSGSVLGPGAIEIADALVSRGVLAVPGQVPEIPRPQRVLMDGIGPVADACIALLSRLFRISRSYPLLRQSKTTLRRRTSYCRLPVLLLTTSGRNSIPGAAETKHRGNASTRSWVRSASDPSSTVSAAQATGTSAVDGLPRRASRIICRHCGITSPAANLARSNLNPPQPQWPVRLHVRTSWLVYMAHRHHTFTTRSG